MQAEGANPQGRWHVFRSLSNRVTHVNSGTVTVNSFPQSSEPLLSDVEPFTYRSQFQDCMQMNAGAEQVASYFKAHQDWFRRCAHPMQVEPIDTNAYALVIGHFGALGYEVEPKVGLSLLSPEQNIFRICTVPLPNDVVEGYTVDFQAAMHLCESVPFDTSAVTQVEWTLDLIVSVRFPRFIYRLPNGVIQGTGDRLLKQIVRQVSRRLTRKVQLDFHTSYGLSLPNGVQSS